MSRKNNFLTKNLTQILPTCWIYTLCCFVFKCLKYLRIHCIIQNAADRLHSAILVLVSQERAVKVPWPQHPSLPLLSLLAPQDFNLRAITLAKKKKINWKDEAKISVNHCFDLLTEDTNLDIISQQHKHFHATRSPFWNFNKWFLLFPILLVWTNEILPLHFMSVFTLPSYVMSWYGSVRVVFGFFFQWIGVDILFL